MQLLGEAIDYGIRGTRESEVTARLFTKLRHEYPEAFIWKIPDIGNKLKPCDGIWIFNGGKVYAVEVKMIKDKTWKDYQSMFVGKMEPLQVLTFHNLTQLGIDCIMLGYHIHTHTFYSIIYKDEGRKKNRSKGGRSTSNRSNA